MATNVKWKWFLIPILGIALLAGGLVPVEGGKPTPPPPPPPPVQYAIQFWEWPAGFPYTYLNKMNNWGQVVGRCWDDDGVSHGFLYDPWTDPTEAVDLNTLGIADIPEGWVIASAVGINDDGVVVGYLRPTDPTITTLRMGYILDTTATLLVLELLPDPEPSSYWVCVRINNSGDVLVAYQNDTTGAWGVKIYNWPTHQWGADAGVNVTATDILALSDNGQVALRVDDGSTRGASNRWTPSTGQFEPILGFGYDINGAGTVCGRTWVKRKGNVYDAYPFRYANSLEVLPGLGAGSSAHAINSNGDLLCWDKDYVGYVYQDTLESFYDVDTLIDPNDLDAAIWSSRSGVSYLFLNNRIGATGFGQIGGKIGFADGSKLGCLLTPK